jgi:FAD/FMN-containing dehydrogenase
VFTGIGELITASPSRNFYLYWAFSGGGSGTYGIVLSVTGKAYKDQPTAAANLTFGNDRTDTDKFLRAVKNFVGNFPPLVDAGAVSIWVLSNTSFQIVPTMAPGVTKGGFQGLLQPFITILEEINITYSMLITLEPMSMISRSVDA